MTQHSAHSGRPESGPEALQETGRLTGHATGYATGQEARQDTDQGIQQDIAPDLCVIGSDAVALATASAAAAFGVSVVLVENSETTSAPRDGGALLSKALLAAASHINAMRTGAHFGVKTVRFGVDFNAVRAHVRDALEALAPLQSRERLKGLGVRVIAGAARFIDRKTLAVEGLEIKARRFVIATGSLPTLPAIAGLAETPFFTCDNILELAECPRHLIVIGAGPAGLEMAQAFRRFGADVTVLDRAEPLAQYDRECAAVVLDALAREHVTVRSNVIVDAVRQVEVHGHPHVQVEIDTPGESGSNKETIDATHILVAAGRRANLAGLALEAARVRYGPRGIAVNRRLRARNRRVYAVGEAAGAPAYPQVAHHQAGLVVRNALFRTPVRPNRDAIPLVIYTDPELAQIGLMEDAARARYGTIRVLRASYRENDRAQASRATNGHIKIVTDRRGGIRGATIVGAEAAESIATFSLAINQQLNIEALAGLLVPYPSFAEVGKRAAMTYFTGGLTSPLVRRIIGWLRRFG
jgi:pyruvate/2-oxoglutarate dehydrogenase complex dihydrolipoamide dehydrogenase (E3) component